MKLLLRNSALYPVISGTSARSSLLSGRPAVTLSFRVLATSHITLHRKCHTTARANTVHKTAPLLSGQGRIQHRFIPAAHPTQTLAMSTSSKSTMSVEEQAKLVESSKKAAAFQAVKDYLLPEYRHIGIGSGSTVVYVVEAISELGDHITSKMTFYPTGEQSRQLILAAELRLAYIEDLPMELSLDVAFDGADEVDDDLNLIKGGGACLMQEKIVASSAKKFVCVADFRKISPRLGTSWKKGIPIEVLPMAAERVLKELKEMGSINPRIRSGLPGKAGPIVTDNGMLIIDAPFAPLLLSKDKEGGIKGGNGEDGIWSVDTIAQRLINIVGIAEIGLFHGHNGLEVPRGAQKPIAAYFGLADGSVKVTKAEESS